MAARIWSKGQLNEVVALTEKHPETYKTLRTGETVKVVNTKTNVEVLKALKGPGGKWIARYDEGTFQ